MNTLQGKGKKIQTSNLDQAQDLPVGKAGTPQKHQFEFEHKLELIGHRIKAARMERKQSPEKLGELIDVRKSQISKL